jgi:plastocyanin
MQTCPARLRALALAVFLSLTLPAAALGDGAIAISAAGIEPLVVTVEPGEPIVFYNRDTAGHSVTFENEIGATSIRIPPGTIHVSHFQRRGSYRYRVTASGRPVTGTVLVQPDSAAAPGTLLPPTASRATTTVTASGGSQQVLPSSGDAGTDWARLAMVAAVGMFLALGVVVVACVVVVTRWITRPDATVPRRKY